MDVFEFREQLISEYEGFSRSFTRIRAEDILTHVDEQYEQGRFWHPPLIQLNPNFVIGGQIEELVSEGLLHEECTKIFRANKDGDGSIGTAISLYKHQEEAIRIAQRRESYVLTTGTGSGKSLSYFIPVVDDILKRRAAGDPCSGISAIVVYPMNALCNSQVEELDKFLRAGYGKGKEPVTFARYTGQESREERDEIAKNPPDILLTNYVMLELIMTRFLEADKAVREHAIGLRFLALDELHTYRGRQGADVAMLVRRVRERFNKELLCIGTSATMASEGAEEDRNKVVATIASRLFGTDVKPDNIITETLEPVTKENSGWSPSGLKQEIETGVPETPSYEDLAKHPMSVWIEETIGLELVGEKLTRISRPKSIKEAAEMLAETTGLNLEQCNDYLSQYLLKAYATKNEKGQSFFAFRLHQFISGAGNLFVTLEKPGERFITVDGQQFQPGNRSKKLFNASFCRDCGQEYMPVWANTSGKNISSVEPRELNERGSEDEDQIYGYFMPDPDGLFDPEDLELSFPEDWIEYRNSVPRIKPNYRQHQPLSFKLNTEGVNSPDGMDGWFLPKSFRFCLNQNCDAQHDARTSDIAKLSGLSNEGRSSATTVLTIASLKYLLGADLEEKTKKLLGFTDNRQDASLQAGHFNDFVQIVIQRGALLAAIKNSPNGVIESHALTQEVAKHLNLDKFDYFKDTERTGFAEKKTEEALKEVLGYRLFRDLQRGWRFTNPNLEQLKLLSVDYQFLEDTCSNADVWKDCVPLLATASTDIRLAVATEILDAMRKALCIDSWYLDPHQQEQIRQKSFAYLREPWGFTEEENRLEPSRAMIPRPRSDVRHHMTTIHYSYRSKVGRWLKSNAAWGANNPDFPSKADEEFYNQLVDDLLRVLRQAGYLINVDFNDGSVGYQVSSEAFAWCLDTPTEEDIDKTNDFFRSLYDNISTLLGEGDRFLHQLEAREHTAQVDVSVREEREAQFRSAQLPVMFCSPTMELGVDISTLNTVYMRNVPPTPANYAQRSGRAGRSGQPALVITYCAVRSPHDQYFYTDPTRMVAGSVNPPTIDLANEDLLSSHIHSVWLAETGCLLGSSVKDVLNLETSEELSVLEDISSQLGRESVRLNSLKRGTDILKMLEGELNEDVAPWLNTEWLSKTIARSEDEFSNTFNRWRSLFQAASTQMQKSNDIMRNAAATEKERTEAKRRYDEAFVQQKLLLDDRRTMNSDFYTYRYLASEGFLPGYNFPRLPLMAFIPARREKVGRDSFLSRPRFLGLTEFGPQSMIYHEGSTYTVRKAILGIRDEESVSTTSSLPVQETRLCPDCGYGHFGEQQEFERCVNCDAKLEGGRSLTRLYRINQVSTRRRTRITSDEEDRQRQGYEMITTFRYSDEDGKPRFSSATFSEGGNDLLDIQFGPAATLWRINLGWMRRKEKSICGFNIDVATGEWAKDEQSPTMEEDDLISDGKVIERITPYVEDFKNVLIVTPKIQMDHIAMVSFQYAIKRGIENVFQLEESELAAEPLPNKKRRHSILLYESSEGGAGVLTRMASDLEAIQRVATQALQICHWERTSDTWKNKSDLTDTDENCEAGCYRCLLSYYNQPDHPEIDRKDEQAINLLCRLTRATGEKGKSGKSSSDLFGEMMNQSTSSLEKEWLNFVRDNGFYLPSAAQNYLDEFNTRPDFIYKDKQVVIYIDGPHHEKDAQKQVDQEITQKLEDRGITVIRFPKESSSWDNIFANYVDVFGKGRNST